MVMTLNKKVPFLYHLGRVLLTPIFKIYYNPVVIGKENLNVSGSMLVVGNHKHFLDQFLTIISTRRGIHYMAKKEYFDDKKVSWFFKGTGCIPVDRSRKDKNCVDLALSVLNDGGAVGLFPEGTRNRTSKLLLPFKFGTVSMAKKTNSYIVPFAITGEYGFRSKPTIRYGKPFLVGDMILSEANDYLYNEVKRLLLMK